MDKQNYEIATKMAQSHNFVVENLGLGSYKHTANYNRVEGNMGASRVTQDGNNTTTITTLAPYLQEVSLSTLASISSDSKTYFVTFISNLEI